MDLPVRIETKYIRKSSQKINVHYPIVTNLTHPAVEKKINADIIHELNKLLIEQGFYSEHLVEMVGTYENKTN